MVALDFVLFLKFSVDGSSRWGNPSDGPSHIYLHLRQQGTSYSDDLGKSSACPDFVPACVLRKLRSLSLNFSKRLFSCRKL